MTIVIDISQYDYDSIIADIKSDIVIEQTFKAIKEGKILPKGHGELIDKDVVLDMMNHGILEEYITTIGGVIPADKGESDNEDG